MQQAVVILGRPGSTLGAQIRDHLRERGGTVSVLALDATLRGEEVSVLPTAVVWQGVDLTRAGAVLAERSIFPWPQPQGVADLIEEGAPSKRLVAAEREARSLALSALEVASASCRVINPPAAAHLAVSPATALDRLARRGIGIHPWRLEPAPGASDDSGRPVLDVAGRDLWHEPAPPPPGQPALTLDPVPVPVSTLFVVGDRVVGALHFRDGRSWVRAEVPAVLAADEIAAEPAGLAKRAASLLELDIAGITVAEGPGGHRVLLADAGPDLEGWNRSLGGRLVPTLADHLAAVAKSREGVVG
jgi:hypothetical protein